MLIPLGDTLLAEGPCAVGIHRLAIGTHDGIDVLGATRTPLDLEDAHARVQHLVEEVDRLEVLGGHDILVVHLQLDARLLILDLVGAPADLRAAPAVGTLALLVEA